MLPNPGTAPLAQPTIAPPAVSQVSQIPPVGETIPATTTVQKDPDAVKLFIGQVPRSYTENDLMPIFQPYGNIFELSILKDKYSGQSKGCAFLTYCTRQSAMNAIADLHEKRTLPGLSNPMAVKLADSEQRAEQRKLFVGMLSRSLTEDGLRQMFSPYGTVESCAILTNADGSSKGCGFVTYSTNQSANTAIMKLHQSTTMEGSRMPLVVRIADNEKQKQQRRMMRVQQHQQPMMPYQGMMGQGMPPVYNAPMQSGFGPNDMSQAFMGLNQFTGAGYGQQPYGQQQFGGVAPRAATQKEGPPNSNLFIYHLPQEFNDAALASTFVPFGNVISSKVFLDRHTGQSKCFGFVSYDNPTSAQNAINSMNGYAIGGKRLKVQLKRPRGTAAPY